MVPRLLPLQGLLGQQVVCAKDVISEIAPCPAKLLELRRTGQSAAFERRCSLSTRRFELLRGCIDNVSTKLENLAGACAH